MTERFTLTALAVDAVRTRLTTRLPPLFYTVGFGESAEERRHLHRRAWAELDSLGLLERGEPVSFLADAFATLSRPMRAVYGAYMIDRTTGANAVSAANGEFAVLATQTEPAGSTEAERPLTIERIWSTSLGRAVVEVLPQVPAGRGVSVSLPSDDVLRAAEAGGRSTAALRSAMTATGLRPGQADVVARTLTAQRLRAGQISATSFDRLTGRTIDGAYRVDFLDTAEGRYLMQHKPSHDGGHWFTIAPSDRAMLASQVDALLSTVEPRR
ncbi:MULTISPECIES: ESX secretion-associated protein EspG [Actinoalloteichus]|uniref:EspG family n=1 Tax=Actinoalloteichus fjordicus TaxID=1612552 RepID=A0AAC9L889_9PSEU|nr:MULTISPECIES: ESX secretion-associated protein EspG [Actinoalloteichus]APU12195.1 EspG family [Actinoalloteichus fjordicus]APU18147.1 EspG family [Actinoalloteichus sp. GBA129-24]